MLTTLSFLGAALFTVAVLYVLYGLRQGLDALLVANRRIPYQFVGIWMAIAFTWGTTFFFASQLAYQSGLKGVLFFIIGNTGGLVIAMILAMKTHSPSTRYSLAGVMKERYDAKTGMFYALTVIGVQAGYALTLQFIVAAMLLSLVLGVEKQTTILAAASAMIVPVVLGGIRSSAVIDTVKGSMMLVLIIVLAPIAVFIGGVDSVMHGLAGGASKSGQGGFDLAFVLTVGIPLVVSLFSAGPIDQSLFQRFFAVKQGPKGKMIAALILGAVFFSLYMAAAAVLGSMAADPLLGIQVTNPRTAGFATIQKLMPALGMVFIVLVVASVAASGDSALNASSSVWAVDVYRRGRPIPDERVKLVQRAAMVLFIVVAAGVALSGVDMLTLVIAVGVFRSVLFVPVFVGLFTDKARVPEVFSAMIVASVASVVLFGTGKVCESTSCPGLPFFDASWYTFAGSLSGWVIMGVYCALVALKSRRPAVHFA